MSTISVLLLYISVLPLFLIGFMNQDVNVYVWFVYKVMKKNNTIIKHKTILLFILLKPEKLPCIQYDSTQSHNHIIGWSIIYSKTIFIYFFAFDWRNSQYIDDYLLAYTGNENTFWSYADVLTLQKMCRLTRTVCSSSYSFQHWFMYFCVMGTR